MENNNNESGVVIKDLVSDKRPEQEERERKYNRFLTINPRQEREGLSGTRREKKFRDFSDDMIMDKPLKVKPYDERSRPLGEKGKMYYDKTNDIVKIYINDTVKWAHFQITSTSTSTTTTSTSTSSSTSTSTSTTTSTSTSTSTSTTTT